MFENSNMLFVTVYGKADALGTRRRRTRRPKTFAGAGIAVSFAAAIIATAEAHGTDILSATQTNALTVENQFSFVNAIAVVIF
jgi:hypothetical protein